MGRVSCCGKAFNVVELLQQSEGPVDGALKIAFNVVERSLQLSTTDMFNNFIRVVLCSLFNTFNKNFN